LERRSSMARCLRCPPPAAAFGCSSSGSIPPPGGTRVLRRGYTYTRAFPGSECHRKSPPN
jgi:hypothetical protein